MAIIKKVANCCLRFRGFKGRKTLLLLNGKEKNNKKKIRSYLDVKKQETKNE